MGLRQTVTELTNNAGGAYIIKLSVKSGPNGTQNSKFINIFMKNIHDADSKLTGFQEANVITYDPAKVVVLADQVNIKPAAFDASGYTVIEFDYIPEDATQIALYIPGSDDAVFDNTTNDATSLGYIDEQDPLVTTSVFQSSGIFQIQRGKGVASESDTYIDNVSMIKYSLPPLSTQDLSLFNFSYYPNPSKDRLNLSAAKNIERVDLYNLLRQNVIRKDLNVRTAALDISNLSKGIYIMKLSIEGAEGSYKIIKE